MSHRPGYAIRNITNTFNVRPNAPCTSQAIHCRELSKSHPARSMPDFAVWSKASGVEPSLKTYLDWKSQALLRGKLAALQYGDLHGVPMMLVLCEKGRMGDTFPQTFRCACIARALILSRALAGSGLHC